MTSTEIETQMAPATVVVEAELPSGACQSRISQVQALLWKTPRCSMRRCDGTETV